MVKHTQTNCLSVFDHFMGLSLKFETDTSLLFFYSESTHIKQAFEGEFPKALHILNDFWSQVSPVIESSKTQVSQSFNNSEMKIGFHSDDKK